MRKALLLLAAFGLAALLCLGTIGCASKAQGQPAAPKVGQPAAQAPAPVTVTAKKVQQNTETIQVDLSIPVVAGLQAASGQEPQERLNDRFEQDALGIERGVDQTGGEDVKEAAKAGYPFRQYSASPPIRWPITRTAC